MASLLQRLVPGARSGSATARCRGRARTVMVDFVGRLRRAARDHISRTASISRTPIHDHQPGDRYGLAQLYPAPAASAIRLDALRLSLEPPRRLRCSRAAGRHQGIQRPRQQLPRAALDLENPWCGQLLVGQQSATSSVGFEMYMKLLEEASRSSRASPGEETARAEPQDRAAHRRTVHPRREQRSPLPAPRPAVPRQLESVLEEVRDGTGRCLSAARAGRHARIDAADACTSRASTATARPSS